MEKVLGLVWAVMNTPAGITIMASVFLYALNRLYAAKPAWAAYEGSIIAAIKFAEKAIPDKSANKSVERLDEALKYVVKVYEEKTGKEVSDKVEAELKEGIQIVHNKLEVDGILKRQRR
jgi:hypothetical protein